LGSPWFDPRARRTFPARPFSLIEFCRGHAESAAGRSGRWRSFLARYVWLAAHLISVAMIFIGAFLNEKAVCRLSQNIHNKSSGRKNL
jgi:hypothetical protein